MTDPIPTRRRFVPTPSWLIFGLLVVEGLLWLSERYRWGVVCFGIMTAKLTPNNERIAP